MKEDNLLFSEPSLYPKSHVQSVLLVPFWYSPTAEEFIQTLLQRQCSPNRKLWERTENLRSIYPFNNTYSTFLKDNWYKQDGKEAQITHLYIPDNSIQFLFKNHEFYAFNDKVPKSQPKHVDKQLSSLKDLPFHYKIESITLEIFPYQVACLSILVQHQHTESTSRSLSLLRRLDSLVVLHSFYNPEKANPDGFGTQKGLFKEHRTHMPDTGFRLGASNHDAPIIKSMHMLELCSKLIQEKANSICEFYSDADGLLYSTVTTKEKADKKQLNQWLYYLSTCNVFPDKSEESVPFHSAEALEKYDLHTFHKRNGLYIRFCREGVLSLGMVPDFRGQSYLRHQWPKHWFKKYLLIYKQVLAEEMIVIGFYKEARECFQDDFQEKKLDSLIDLSQRMHRFLMSFRLLDCGHCTDLNAFFDSSRDIMSLDQRIKILRESMAQIVQQISHHEKELQNHERAKRHQDSLNQQNKTLERLEKLLENQESQAKTQTQTLNQLKILLENQETQAQNQTQTLYKLKLLLENQKIQNEIQGQKHKNEALNSKIFQLIGLVFLPITAVTGWMGMNKNSASSGLTPEGVEISPIIAFIVWIIIVGCCVLYFINRYFKYNINTKEEE